MIYNKFKTAKFFFAVLCSLLVVVCSVCHSNQPDRKTYFILVDGTGLISDLQQIYSPEKYDLILLINKEKINSLTTKQKKKFSAILPIPTGDFTYENLKTAVDSVISQKHAKSEIRFITNDEGCLAIAGKLRDHFKTKEPSFLIVSKFLNKSIMKKELNINDSSIRTPRYIMFNPEEYISNPVKYENKIINFLSFPIFAKPIDDACARFTNHILSKEELIKWLSENKDKTNFELDEFILGDLYHCDSLVQEGNIIFTKVSKYNMPCAEFLNGKPIGSIVLPEQNEDTILISKFNQKVLKALSPVPNGAFHLEVFKKSDGTLVFLEIAARAPGAYVPQTYNNAYGISIEEAHFKLQMGIPCNDTCEIKKNSYAAWMWYPKKKGTVNKFIQPKLESNFLVDWKVKVGDQDLQNATKLGDVAAGIQLWNDDYQVLKQDFNSLINYFPYE